MSCAAAVEVPSQNHLMLPSTQGIINDMDETVLKLEEASELPLSIIIVGVGEADFTNMDLLCEQYKHIKVAALPTLPYLYHCSLSLQFIPMAEYVDQALPELSSILLNEVPSQVDTCRTDCFLRAIQLSYVLVTAGFVHAQERDQAHRSTLQSSSLGRQSHHCSRTFCNSSETIA